jgi:hypothetical protein
MPQRLYNHFWFAVITPALLGYGMALFCIFFAQLYGAALFIALPIVVSFLAAFFYCYKNERAWSAAYQVTTLSMLVLGGFILVTNVDGLICLFMALPLALLMGLGGSYLGRLAGRAAGRPLFSKAPVALIIGFPCLVAFEEAAQQKAPLRAVTTSVSIKASPMEAWDTVVAFPPIHRRPDGIFRFGIAYPKEARIEGTGVGAVRYCTFSTGSFVEPITNWKPGELLAFDVTSSPPPMDEFSLYEHIDPPHLHGYLRSHRGQFRFIPGADGLTLEGTTWYSHEMWPQWYWAPVTDYIIHQIHHRVLDHIKTSVEK